MKKRLLLLWCCVALLQVFSFAANGDSTRLFKLAAHVKTTDYLPNTLIIKYKTLQPAAELSQKSKSSHILPINIVSQRPFFTANVNKLSLLDQSKVAESGLNLIYEVTYSEKQNIETVINKLLQDESIAYAEPVYICHTFVESPNDPELANNKQASLRQIKAPEAWQIQSDASHQIIAIIDSGTEFDHPDIAANIYFNTADPVNGIDDDGDGFIDNYKGWDFVGATSSDKGDNDPSVIADSLDHGEHVSGIASAVTNNGKGVASVAQNAKLMILKAGADDDADAIYTSAAYKAMVYAADKGAKIINCSWGRDGGASAFEQEMVNYAINKGCLIVAAAGNESDAVPIYPAAYNGVFAVANVNSNDVKASSSSYGAHVSISAPGTSIYSTTFSHTYGYKTGTSMSSPLVASAAALLAEKYPALSGQQLGEILRNSADDIYSLNGNKAYINQLGAGRLNILKALNGANKPAIRKQNLQVNDPSGSRAIGDTLLMSIDLKNFLQPATALNVALSSASNAVEVLNGPNVVGALGTLEEANSGTFKVRILPAASKDEEVIFKITYTSSPEGYEGEEYFSLTLNRNYINYQVNQIKTTFTSNGRVGYSQQGGVDGNGLVYKNKGLLYEASLMIGKAGNMLSDNARSTDGEANNDFVPTQNAQKQADDLAAFKAISVFNDNASEIPLNLEITHTQYAFSASPDDKYIIADYEINNKSNIPLNNIYAGLFTDWDISESEKNVTKFDNNLGMSYNYSFSDATAPYGGVKLLNSDLRYNYYPMSYMLSSDLLADDFFSKSEKFTTLSSGVFKQTLGESNSGLDIMCVTSSGPFDIPANSSIKVAFAFLAGDNLTDLQNSAAAAQQKYEEINAIMKKDYSTFELSQNYPNPVNSSNHLTTIDVKLPEKGALDMNLYDLAGKKVANIAFGDYGAGIHKITINTNGLKTGIYYCSAVFNGKRKAVKMVVAN